MTELFALNPEYSTTRLVTREVPIIEEPPDAAFKTVLFLPDGEDRKGEGGLRTQGNFKRSLPDKPLITVITVVFNGAEYLEQTILSVLEQTYENVEYIVIDGGSTDGTLDIIYKYEHVIDYWVSEKDGGIYDAMNKGIILSTGNIIGILNSDDCYDSSSICKIVKKFSDNLLKITYGITQLMYKGNCMRVNKGVFNPKSLYSGMGFLHPSVFSGIDVYKKIGLFNNKYKIAGDSEWLLRVYMNNIPFFQEKNITYMETTGISNANPYNAYLEYLSALRDNGLLTNKILLHYNRFSFILKALIKRIIGERNILSFRSQVLYFFVLMYNFTYNKLPFFFLKKKFLKFSGVKIGISSYIHTPVRFFTIGKVKIGDNTTINPFCYLDNRAEIEIHNNVNISHNVRIYTLGHNIQSMCSTVNFGKVTIKDHVFIFPNVLIMPGVTIAEGAVIYPGSVVTKDVERFTIVAGNPAKYIKKRNRKINYKLDFGYWFVI